MAARAVLLTLSALALTAGAAFAQDGGNAQAREDLLRGGTLDLRPLETDEPFLDGPQNEPVLPAQPIEAAPPSASDDVQDFDLFEGPSQPASAVRQNPPGERGNRAAGPLTDPAQRPEARVGQAPLTVEPYQTLAPVRSPTFAPALAAGRVNRATESLRPSLPAIEDDPYAPLGIRTGRFLLFPTLEQEFGVSDNLGLDTAGRSGAFSETRFTARLLSDWSHHELDLNASATYRGNFASGVDDEPRLAVDGRMRFDISRDWTGRLRGALSYAREDAILADPTVPTAERPDILSYSAGGEIERDIGRFNLAGSVDVAREDRQETFGIDRDFTTATLGLRAGYEIAPALRPFLAASVSERRFADDALGDSQIPALRAGIRFDRGEKLSGEAAIGYAWNRPTDDSLPTLSSPTLDLSLNWSPRRGTDVLLTAATYFDPDATALTTSTVYETGLALRHRASARNEITGRLGAAFRERQGDGTFDDVTYTAEAGLTHWLRRGLALTALVRHERLESEAEGADYSANSIRLGLRVQR